MSLRAFHIIFITVCVAFCLFVTVWGVREYRDSHSLTALGVAVTCCVAGMGLIVYGRRIFLKFKELP